MVVAAKQPQANDKTNKLEKGNRKKNYLKFKVQVAERRVHAFSSIHFLAGKAQTNQGAATKLVPTAQQCLYHVLEIVIKTLFLRSSAHIALSGAPSPPSLLHNHRQELLDNGTTMATTELQQTEHIATE